MKNSFLRPLRSNNLPTIGVAIAIPNLYKVMPHVPAVASILKDEFIVVRAALIIPLSKAAIKTPINNVINPNVTLDSFVFSVIYTTSLLRSEERRVGKECRSDGSRY